MSVKIFCCYAHEDEPLLNKLKSHLRPLQYIGRIEIWHDRDISAGAKWEEEINKNLNEAQIILLLISPDFMNSDYCYGKEMKKALERHKRGEAVVIPIILRRVHWQDILGDIQALPRDGEPVMSSLWHSPDDAFFDVIEGIKQAIKNLKSPPLRNPPIPKQTPDVREPPPKATSGEKKVSAAIELKPPIQKGEIRQINPSAIFNSPFERNWKMLRNPYQAMPESAEMITSHVSGRKADIEALITEGHNAAILIGAPHIGKTSLIRYLQRPATAVWSWRDELEDLRPFLKLDEISFAQIDLSQLEGVTDVDASFMPFVNQCIAALYSVRPHITGMYSGLKGLRELLRHMTRDYPDAQYFIVLDSIEWLQWSDMPILKAPTTAITPQEYVLEWLDEIGAFRVLVDLMDEFAQFGVILSIESLPLPKVGDQFTHISADLARFRTMPLQAFTQEDTLRFLAQEAENFGEEWAHRFREVGGNVLFSQEMQAWIYEHAGTHPYLLQQFCFHAFHFKRELALRRGSWSDLQFIDRGQLLERVTERSSTFLDRTWRRITTSLEMSSQETKEMFYDFITENSEKNARYEIDPTTWNQLSSELRYILSSEGIVRYDPLQPVYYPGSVLLNYLARRVQEQAKLVTPARLFQAPTTIKDLSEDPILTLPGEQSVYLELSLLEHQLMKTLLQHPQRCSEEELMKAAWGKIVSRQTFTQRMHHLRKKLRDYCRGEEMIENRYGGLYLLNHPDWFRIE